MEIALAPTGVILVDYGAEPVRGGGLYRHSKPCFGAKPNRAPMQGNLHDRPDHEGKEVPFWIGNRHLSSQLHAKIWHWKGRSSTLFRGGIAPTRRWRGGSGTAGPGSAEQLCQERLGAHGHRQPIATHQPGPQQRCGPSTKPPSVRQAGISLSAHIAPLTH